MLNYQPLGLLFFRGSGLFAWLERAFCRFPCQPMREVPGHVGVRIGDEVFEAVVSGVRRVGYGSALGRVDFLREVGLPRRTEAQIAAARGYASDCLGEAYGWADIWLIVWAWAAPGVVERVASGGQRRRGLIARRQGTVCSVFALLALAHAGCRLHECVGPEPTPNELMMRAEDYADAGVDVGVGADSGDENLMACGARGG